MVVIVEIGIPGIFGGGTLGLKLKIELCSIKAFFEAF